MPEESEPDCAPSGVPEGVPDGVPLQNYSSQSSERSSEMSELLLFAARILVQLDNKSLNEKDLLGYIAQNTNLAEESQQVFKKSIFEFWLALDRLEYMKRQFAKYEKMSIGSLMKALPALQKVKAPLSFGFYE